MWFLVLASLFSFNISSAQSLDLPLSSFTKGKLVAKIQNKLFLEQVAANKGWLIKGKVYPSSFDADAAVARRQIVCSFIIPSKELKAEKYVLYLADHYVFNAHHLEMIADNKFFGVTCFKNDKLPEMTLEDLNQAFIGLVNWEPNW